MVDLRGRRHAAALLACALSLSFGIQSACRSRSFFSKIPPSLNDGEFWNLSASLSEPGGTFTHSDNLVSNETQFAHVVRMLEAGGGAYIGVGPEQNFSYIAKLEPAIAFIIDIRPANRNLHLMYKALFELSSDRADFLSRLFSRERPSGVGRRTAVEELFSQYARAKPDARLHDTNARLVRERLLEVHRFPLTAEDLSWIDYSLDAFFRDGPDIHYARLRPKDDPGPSYRVLMTSTDVGGQPRSFLATEEAFAAVKDLQGKNLIVPVVGDFAGPHAIRRAGDYIRQHVDVVRAFYGSNVEVYLSREKIALFCRNLATLPRTSGTLFIGSKGMQSLLSKVKPCLP
jgi:hypothetical protein